MGITGGFGTTMDLERGTSRKWVMGRDGVKRWEDSGEQVQKPETMLPNDVARCAGVGDDEEGRVERRVRRMVDRRKIEHEQERDCVAGAGLHGRS